MSDSLNSMSPTDLIALMGCQRTLLAPVSLNAVLDEILTQAGRLTDASEASVILRHPDPGALYVAAATGPKAEQVLATFGRHSVKRIPVEGSKAGIVMTSGKSLVENHLTDHFKGVEDDLKVPTRSMVCVPLTSGEEMLGVVQLLNKRDGGFGDRDRILLEHFAVYAALAIRNAQVIETLSAHCGFPTRWDGPTSALEVIREVSKPAHAEHLTVMFADLRGFTQLCQSESSPAIIQSRLNEFLTMLADEVSKRDGTVNKFLGDGLMALFREDDHARRCVEAAFAITRRFPALLERWNDGSSQQLDFLDVGIGIATGEVTLGGIGTDDVRDYTAIGSVVNLASAFERQARDGRRILANHHTYSLVKELVTTETLEAFQLMKPGQTVGIVHKRYWLKSLRPLRPARLFISHSHEDREFVEGRIVAPLRELGIDTWYAPDDIPKGSLWTAEIRRGLAGCTGMIVVVSARSEGSEWVKLEVDLAMSIPGFTSRIIPLLLDDTPSHRVNPYLMGLHGFHVRNTPAFVDEVSNVMQTWMAAPDPESNPPDPDRPSRPSGRN